MSNCDKCLYFNRCDDPYNNTCRNFMMEKCDKCLYLNRCEYGYNDTCRGFKNVDENVEKHGKWIEDLELGEFGGNYSCSVCGNPANENTYGSLKVVTRFCSGCGADMRGDKKWEETRRILLDR